MQSHGTLRLLEEVDIPDVFAKNHWSHKGKSQAMSQLTHISLPHENNSWKCSHAIGKPRTKPDLWMLWNHLFALEEARQFTVILRLQFNADISELSKLSRAQELTDNSRTSFYTRIPLLQSLHQEEKKSAGTPHLATLMRKPILVSAGAVGL